MIYNLYEMYVLLQYRFNKRRERPTPWADPENSGGVKLLLEGSPYQIFQRAPSGSGHGLFPSVKNKI